MGSYVYTIREKSISAVMLPENKKVTIALAKYLCKDSSRLLEDKEYARERSAMTRAHNLVENGFNPEFYATSFDYDGAIYKFDGRSAFSDGCGSMGEYGGYMINTGARIFILPIDKRGNFNLKKYFPSLYNDYSLPCTQMYVKMNGHYTATVRNLASLEDYMFGFGKDDVDVKLLSVQSRGNDVPDWFAASVQQLINKRLLMDKEKLNENTYASWFMDMEPEYYDNLK